MRTLNSNDRRRRRPIGIKSPFGPFRAALCPCLAAATAVAIGVFAPFAHTDASEPCLDDMKERVRGGDGCFAIDVVRKKDIRPGEPLVAFIHGDAGALRDDGYYRNCAHQFDVMRDRGINAIAAARPGFWVATGKTTATFMGWEGDTYLPEVVDGLAAVLKRLRGHYNPSRLILLGHSGGTMISGILLGRHPGVADGAVLVAWGCDIYTWRQWRIDSAGRRGLWPQSLSARDFIAKIPVGSVRVVAVTGTRDDHRLPKFGRECIYRIMDRGIDARFELASNWGHGSVLFSESVTNAIEDVATP